MSHAIYEYKIFMYTILYEIYTHFFLVTKLSLWVKPVLESLTLQL